MFDRPWEAFQDLRRALLPTGGDDALKVDVIAFLSPFLIALTPAAGQLLIFFGTLFFFVWPGADPPGAGGVLRRSRRATPHHPHPERYRE